MLAFIMVLVGIAIATLSVGELNIGGFKRGSEDTPLGLKLGLDLQGGTHLVYRADDPTVTSEQIDGVVDIISDRVNAFGVSEPLIQKKGDNEIIIQLPGVTDIDEAKSLIGETAQLDFRECANAACTTYVPAVAEGSGGVQKHLTGAFLRPTSTVVTSPQTGLPEVSFEFNDEGTRMFEQITRRNLQQPLGIFLDARLISAPIVQGIISRTGRITGLTRSDARRLSLQLNSGSLPVSIRVVREQDVSATLGDESLDKSYVAAAIGLGLVMLFILLYYRALGVVAVASLLIYSTFVLALFKLFGVVLELSGLAAFVISVGMAVDANVIIFERMREELRSGRSLAGAIETGFDRAWSAIRDANATTFLVMVILWWFGDQLGETRVIGFAITLMIALATSMFTAFVVSRTLLRLMVGTTFAQRTGWFADLRYRESPTSTRPATGL